MLIFRGRTGFAPYIFCRFVQNIPPEYKQRYKYTPEGIPSGVCGLFTGAEDGAGGQIHLVIANEGHRAAGVG